MTAAQARFLVVYVEPHGRYPSRWHLARLPAADYAWSRLAGWAASALRFYTGYDCGKLVWLPHLDYEGLRPARVVWASPDPNEAVPDLILQLWPFAFVSLVLTPRIEKLTAASPAILTKASTSPWTVDATFNFANNSIYCIGAGGNGGSGAGSQGGNGGGGGAIVFASNYNGGWTPGVTTVTFQVAGGQSTANDPGGDTTFDSAAFVAGCGGINGLGSANAIPAGGIGHNGGTPGSNASFGGGGGGGGAAGTTGTGATGGSGTILGNSGGGGGGGADGGTAGGGASSQTGGNGGASGLTGSTGGTGGSSPTSGTGGGGGGGGNGALPGTNGANGSAGASGTVTPQFDASHGCGGGGGGGGGVNSGIVVINGGNGGQYGGGAGGSGHSPGAAGNGGIGGDGLIFATWSGTPPSTATPIFGIWSGLALAGAKLLAENPVLTRRGSRPSKD